MNRKDFLKSLALLPLARTSMQLNDLTKITEKFGTTDKMLLPIISIVKPGLKWERNYHCQKLFYVFRHIG
jgi:hypothetical protein